MTTTAAPTGTMRLLAGTGSGQRLGFGEHLSTHGPLSMPRRKAASSWREQLLNELRISGLTGRGGGGFPTAVKLATARNSRKRPVMIINAMEGEPAAQKDSVLASFAPHLIIDGAQALGLLIDATSVVFAVARDNPAAARSLEAAIDERRGRLDDQLEMSVVSPPGRYVAGEESALTHWLDGASALPTFRPQKPATMAVKGRQGVVDNAETAAHVALIARHGAAWFSSVGSQGGAGTTLVTISGAVRDPGVFEVALGSPLRSILALAGASGSPTGVILGGYGGAVIGPEALDAPYAPDGLRPHGGSVGAGVIIVLDAAACGITETARLARWMAKESAGQCGPCVFGLPALASDLELLASGRGDARIDRRIERHLVTIDGRGACGHPDGVVRLVRSALRVFNRDVNEHLHHRACEAHRASSLLALPPNEGALEWR